MKVAACILVIPKRQTNLRLSSGILPVVNSYCKETRFTLSATSGSPCTLKHGDKSFTSVTLLVLFVNSISNLWPRSLSHPTVSRSPPSSSKVILQPKFKTRVHMFPDRDPRQVVFRFSARQTSLSFQRKSSAAVFCPWARVPGVPGLKLVGWLALVGRRWCAVGRLEGTGGQELRWAARLWAARPSPPS